MTTYPRRRACQITAIRCRATRVTSCVAIAAAAAGTAAPARRNVAGVLLALVSWIAINSALIAARVWLFEDRGLMPQPLGPRAQPADSPTSLGVALGWRPAAAEAVLALVLAGHRLAPRDSIRGESSAYDVEAGMWSEAGWRVQASESIADAPGCVALVLIDPVRPRNEAAIAQCLRGVLRPSDPVGRYGTRQVAALVQVDIAAVGRIITERVRARLERAGIDCVVGVSISVGEELGELLVRAGSDLMARRESAGISARW